MALMGKRFGLRVGERQGEPEEDESAHLL